MAKTETVSKYQYPELTGNETEDQKKEILRIRATSTREAQKDVIDAVKTMDEGVTLAEVRVNVADALAFLADRAKGRKGTAGEGAVRAPKSNVVADYFKGKDIGDKIDAADVFFDLDMDPARVLSALKRFVSTVKDTSTRVWVSYDKASRAYVVAGYGAEVPRGFTAYTVEVNAAEAV